MGFESFFYTFDDFPERPTYAQIRRKLKPGTRRQNAFMHFATKHPDAIGYRLGYAESYAENGIYDDSQYRQVFEWIEGSFALADADGAYVKLRALLAALQTEQRNLHEEIGPDPEIKRDPLDTAFRTGKFELIESEFTRSLQSVSPRGILGGDDEKRFWRLFQMMIRIAFQNGQPELAIERLDRYEEMRIGVKLTPIPDFDLQESILGYLAKRSPDLARSRLAHWLSCSRMPIINDTIKQHDVFRDLFAS